MRSSKRERVAEDRVTEGRQSGKNSERDMKRCHWQDWVSKEKKKRERERSLVWAQTDPTVMFAFLFSLFHSCSDSSCLSWREWGAGRQYVTKNTEEAANWQSLPSFSTHTAPHALISLPSLQGLLTCASASPTFHPPYRLHTAHLPNWRFSLSLSLLSLTIFFLAALFSLYSLSTLYSRSTLDTQTTSVASTCLSRFPHLPY